MKKLDKYFLLGLYLFNLGTVSLARATLDNPFSMAASFFGVIVGGLCICKGIELDK